MDGLVVKKVAAVPSGPIKLNGPAGLLLPAIWNRSVVFAGTVAFHDSVFQRATGRRSRIGILHARNKHRLTPQRQTAALWF